MPDQNSVAIYVRVSTEEQAEHGYSIEAQLELLRQHCQAHHKTIFREYVDGGVSGKSVHGRKALQSLLRDAKQQRFREVLIWKVNRMARNVVDLMEIVQTLHEYDCTLHSLSESFDSQTPIGKFILQMLGATAEFERNTIIENTRMGMQQRAKAGIYCNTPILGYELVPDDTGETRFCVHEGEASLIRHIFQLYACGKGLRAIVNQLNREGFTTKKGKPFSIAIVRDILLNPVYFGKVRYTALDGQSVVVDGQHEAIISTELWEHVQQQYASAPRSVKKIVKRSYPLTGILKCPLCGSGMIAHHIRKRNKNGSMRLYHYYVCSNYTNKGRTVCKPNSIPAEKVEKVVWCQVGHFLSNPVLVQDIVEHANSKQRERIIPLQLELERIEKDLEQLQQRRQKYLVLFEQDGMEQRDLVERLRELKDQIQALMQKKQEIIQEIEAQERELVPLPTILAALNQWKKVLSVASPDQKNSLLRVLVDQITINAQRELESVTIDFGEALRKQRDVSA
ncbi:recombinase family protein [Brevibacillus sp. GCM10020057]|uniref:recombinase family protein n=1 Tax=Brevibacillus sp. GCM10020057 TaxID=3317327 RepID=UPI0036256B30